MECALWLVSASETKGGKQELHQPHVVLYVQYGGTRFWLLIFAPHARRSFWKRTNGTKHAFFCGRQGGVGAVAVHTLQFNARANIGVQGRHLLDVLLRISWSALMGAHWRRNYTLLDERRTREQNQSHNRACCARGIEREQSLVGLVFAAGWRLHWLKRWHAIRWLLGCWCLHSLPEALLNYIILCHRNASAFLVVKVSQKVLESYLLKN